ncbi:MAG: ATP-dependent sacrificial sulfur transferase LarE [Planctomycetia bacterium]|nr:ATP-dependent sacrificial sulfur transferase LarE [Planctomycetia bacterium]
MEQRDRLTDWFRDYARVYVAFSGGLDSSTLLAAARRSSPDGSRPVTAVYTGGMLAPRGEEAEAARIAAETGVSFVTLRAGEEELADLLRNDRWRCYYCKKRKLSCILDWLGQYEAKLTGTSVLVDGSNADDQKDWRPGTKAKEELGVRSPFAELGLGKDDIRHLARQWHLSVAEKPSSPCLASRIAYDLAITPERLEQIDVAEAKLHEYGFDVVRFRVLTPDRARIEVAAHRVNELLELEQNEKILESLKQLGFREIEIDRDGFVSGKLNTFLR